MSTTSQGGVGVLGVILLCCEGDTASLQHSVTCWLVVYRVLLVAALHCCVSVLAVIDLIHRALYQLPSSEI